MQRRFFELLTDVPRIGPRAALRMFGLPVSTLAKAIELQDTKLLKSLPGVGAQKAKDIISTLARKLGAFVDAKELAAAGEAPSRPLAGVEVDAVTILVKLGTNRGAAVEAVQAVREADPEVGSAEEIVRRVFKAR